MSADLQPRTLALAAAAAAALAAYALDGRPLAWLLVGVVGVALFVPWSRTPRRFAALLATFNATVIAAVVLLVAFSRHVPMLRDSVARPLVSAEGVAAALLVTLFLAGRRIWSPARHLLPAVVTLFVVVGLNERAPDYLPLAVVAAAAFWIYALTSSGPRAGLAQQLAFAAPALALAAGLVVFLPWAQPFVEAYTARLLENQATSGLSDTTRLGDVSRLALSRRVILRLWTTPLATRPWLLRTHVFTEFTGRGWKAATTVARTPLSRAPSGLLPTGALGALLAAVPGAAFSVEHMDHPFAEPVTEGGRVLLSRVAPGALPLTADVALVKLDDVAPARNAFGLVRPQYLPPRLYGFAAVPPATGEAATQAPTALTPPDTDLLTLRVPLDPRTVALARQLAAEAEADADDPGAAALARLERTVALLQTRYRYTLEPGEFTSDDPLAEFLFVKKQAYCEYFASAAAVLLRLQGVATRYVKGLSVGAHNRVGDHYVVREGDAHAWIEAWIPGRGWLEADPTPPGQFAAVHVASQLGWLEQAQERLIATAQEAWAHLVAADWSGLVGLFASTFAAAGRWLAATPLFGVGLLVLVALWLALRAWTRRRHAGRATRAPAPRLPPDVERLGREIESLWRRLGQPRPASRGLLEHAARVRATGADHDACDVGEEATRAYYASAFGNRPFASDALEALGRRLRATRA